MSFRMRLDYDLSGHTGFIKNAADVMAENYRRTVHKEVTSLLTRSLNP